MSKREIRVEIAGVPAVRQALNVADERRADAQRAFNRLDAAITHHRKTTEGFRSDADDALYHAQRAVYRDFGHDSTTTEDA